MSLKSLLKQTVNDANKLEQLTQSATRVGVCTMLLMFICLQWYVQTEFMAQCRTEVGYEGNSKLGLQVWWRVLESVGLSCRI